MRQCLAILLFFSVSCQLVAKIGVIAWFEANRSYVVTELCENRDQPQKKCAGKCYLKKQLNSIDQEQNNQQLPSKKQKTELPEYVAVAPAYPAILYFESIDKIVPTYTDSYSYTSVTSIFHPPPHC